MSSNTTGKSGGRKVLAAGAAILLYLVAVNGLRNTGGGGGTATVFIQPEDRRPFTPIRGRTIPAASPWSLASLRGRVVLLNYAATWCAPCRRETPDLAAVAAIYSSREVVIVGLMMDEGSTPGVNAAVAQYSSQYAVPYPLIRPDDDPLLRLNGLGLPTSILLDRRGRAARTYIGPISKSELTADIKRLLHEDTAPQGNVQY